MLPTTDEILAKLAGSNVFLSLDAASGFWQIPLHSESSLLTTFITPFARYCFKRLPFGISIAPEIFQRKMNKLLGDLAVYMDDLIVHGKSQEEHDECLRRVLESIEQAGLKLNKEKCIFRQKELHFLGHVINERGVRPDPGKVRAIAELQALQTVSELKCVLGMINYMGRYIPDLATVGSPLFDLLKGTAAWTWDQP